MSSAVVGARGVSGAVFVDSRGAVQVPACRAELDWMVGGHRWHEAATEPAVRQLQVGGAPVIETRLSVAGGDVVQRVFGVAGAPAIAVIEWENCSPEAVSLAVLVRGESGRLLRSIEHRGALTVVDSAELLVASRPSQQWARGSNEAALRSLVGSNGTISGPFETLRDRRRGVCAAFVWPLPHRALLRCAVPLGRARAGALARCEPEQAPTADEVGRGWKLQLEQAMRVDVDDERFTAAIDGARAAALILATVDRPRPTADLCAALEDWGYDTEAAVAWQRLSGRDRRAAASREANTVDPWVRTQSHLATNAGGPITRPAQFLLATRELLMCERADGVELLPGFPDAWRGVGVAVHHAPTRSGLVSFALRWHGARPALLWEAPAGLALTAPRLDPEWRSTEANGEALLTHHGV